MRKTTRRLVGGLALGLAVGLAAGHNRAQGPAAAPVGEPGRAADADSIRQAGRDFAAAFGRGDADVVAALWTDQGECHEASGDVHRGRAAIAAAFAAHFQEHPKARLEVHVESIRFPAADVAVEEGLLRQVGAGKELPSTTRYSAVHVREGGRWRIAVSREWGAGQDRLEDLDWLVGTWRAAVGDQEVTLVFKRDEGRPFLHGEIAKGAAGKAAAVGTLRVGLDPQRGQLRSWHFEADGGHGQALWVRDGNRWVLDAAGTQGDGTPTAAVNLLGRVGPDAITWRSIDRVQGDQALPDTVPIKLTRVAGK